MLYNNCFYYPYRILHGLANKLDEIFRVLCIFRHFFYVCTCFSCEIGQEIKHCFFQPLISTQLFHCYLMLCHSFEHREYTNKKNHKTQI